MPRVAIISFSVKLSDSSVKKVLRESASSFFLASSPTEADRWGLKSNPKQ